jgi:D-sedoheptulose 7-phosphate isomerase
VTGSVESFYPFLYAQTSDLEAVLEEVRRSTVAKAGEIAELRRTVAGRHAARLAACAEAMAAAFADGGTLYTFGNGGSSTDAQEVATRFLHPKPGARPLPALSLIADVATLTALSNDVGFEVVFARQIAAFARAGDVALGISTSGGSTNVMRGFEEARKRKLLTVGFAGYDGGRMAEADTIDFLFVVPSASVHRIQEAQTTLYHVLWELVQQTLTPPL